MNDGDAISLDLFTVGAILVFGLAVMGMARDLIFIPTGVTQPYTPPSADIPPYYNKYLQQQ